MTNKPDHAQWASNYLVCDDLDTCARTYEKTFGFKLESAERDDRGQLQHTEWSHNGKIVFMAGPEQGDERAPASLGIKRMPVTFYIYVDDVDAQHRHVAGQGGAPNGEPEAMPWGDRAFTVNDPAGYTWMFAEAGA
jgi:uncharacterized glyoxalase superfamily protein PhnB